MHVLEHLTFATTTCTFMHDCRDIFIWSDYLNCRTMSCCPWCFCSFSHGQQHSVDALFRRRTRVEVIAEQFMKACAVVKATIMDNDLFAIKVCVAKWWCDIHNSFVIIAVSLVEYFLDGSDALQQRETKSKKPGVRWTDRNRVERFVRNARLEEKAAYGLCFEPFDRLVSKAIKLMTKSF